MRNLERTVVLLAAVCWIMRSHVIAGPVKRSSRMVREVYPEIEPEKEGNLAEVCIVGDVVYGIDEPVPAEQPCLRCRCQPPGVQCETTRCIKRPGCKTIHKPNQCCPDYQCECEYNGRIYANGERLETSPGNECKVCYCRGGEIQCADVTCYIRNDCEGRTVPGQCCPKYDHCPPKEPAVKSFLEATQSTASSEEIGSSSWITSFPTYNTTPKSFLYEPPPENNIQIKESIKESAASVQQDEQSDNEQPKITIQEIIPAIKEIPMTEPPRVKEKENIKANDVELKLSDTVTEIKEDNDVVTFDVESDSSEISEIYHHPPPVLRIGDKLLFLKKGELVPEKDTSTPASVITIIGAEGLQRGFEDSAETIENPENATKRASAALEIASTTENLNVIPLQVVTSTESNINLQETQTEIVTTENGLEAATTIEATTSSRLEEALTTTQIYVTTEEIENKTESLENDTLVNTEENLTTEANVVEISPVPLDDIKDEPLIMEDENPAYPPIPEIMVPQVVEDLPEQDEEEPKEIIVLQPEQNDTDSKILPGVLDIRNNHSIPSNITHPEWLKNESLSNPNNLVNLRAALPQHILQERVDSDMEYSVTEEIASTTNGISTTEAATTESTTVETQKQVIVLADDRKATNSKETLEVDEESGEVTTKKNSHASLMSNENASIDIMDNESPEDIEMEEDERTEVKRVELKDGKVNENISPKMAIADVEMFDPTTIKRTYDVETIAPSPEKIVEKRENSLDKQIFQQLDSELKAEVEGNGKKTVQEEKKEAEEIFKELLEETNTTPKIKTTESQTAESRDKDTNTLQRVSDAIARFQLRDTKQSLDSSILGILRDFFTSQYRSYNGRN